MNVLLVHAHPDPRSLNGALTAFSVRRLEAAGHAVQVSDLYAMQWKATLDAGDNTALAPGARFSPTQDSRNAYEQGTQRADISREQDKLRWADMLILQFPLWWFSMPAIMKGWVERVYANGFAYGVGEHSDTHWGDRYGEGMLAGKRAMLVITIGGWDTHYGPRGVNGPIEDLLFPIHHGTLFYPGFDVLPPHLIYRTSRLGMADFPVLSEALGARLDTLASTPPIPFRKQNGGDYLIPALTLRADIAPGETGLAIHQRAASTTE